MKPFSVLAGLLGAAAALLVVPALPSAGGEKKDEGIIAAEQLTKAYATDPKGFDKTYKGKELVVEGVVANANAADFGSKDRMLMFGGYLNPGDKITYRVRCPVGPEFDGLRMGQKIRVRGTCQGHKDTLWVAELRDAKLLRVFADDYPPSDAVKAELKKLDGTWNVVTAEVGGKKLTGKDIALDKFIIRGRQIYLYVEGSFGIMGLWFDPTKAPRPMDWINADDSRVQILYAFDGERLRLALPANPGAKGVQRPKGFGGNDVIAVTAERQKGDPDKKPQP